MQCFHVPGFHERLLRRTPASSSVLLVLAPLRAVCREFLDGYSLQVDLVMASPPRISTNT